MSAKKAAFAFLIVLLLGCSVEAQVPAGGDSKIKIDPAMFLELKECRNIMMAIGDRIWKGWDLSKMPILFYRPGVQDILIGYPHQPAGFQPLTGFNPLPGETVYVRDGKTFIGFDGQNTVTDIDGVKTLVVADTFSNQRNQIRGVFQGRDPDFALKWLENWNFLPEDPVNQIATILHEGFHAYQNLQAPDKNPNELAAIDYPLLDVLNNSYWGLEAAIIQGALTSGASDAKLDKIKELVAVRLERRAALKKECIEYEDLAEYLEGLAKYVEYKFLISARGLRPLPELFVLNGFSGYGDNLKERLADRFKQMKDIIAASVDVTGNKFGVGPLRFRLYSSGAALALLLDDVDPGWKTDIFQSGVTLFDKLQRVVRLDEAERLRLVARAKSEYGFEDLRKDKAKFEVEGRQALTDKLRGILGTKETLVVVDYSELGEIAWIAFTPFGVTKVAENLIIYDLIPISVKFKGSGEFKCHRAIAVLVDKAKKSLSFAVKTSSRTLVGQKGDTISVDEFTLTGVRFDAASAGNTVNIKLLK